MPINSHQYSSDKTIFALSTLFCQSSVAVVRISGKDSLKSLAKFEIKLDPIPRYCYFVKIKINGVILDNCLMIYFRNPNSFTGEDIVEFHLHGSRAVINLVLKHLGEIDGFVMAEPGEFTKRAFLNDKIDLIQAEGLLSVIHSETEEQLFQANKQLSGDNSQVLDSIRREIITIFANCEALLDFPEDDLNDSSISSADNTIKTNILDKLVNIKSELESHLNNNFIGEKIYDGFKIAIVGEPNVGKSSLINYLANKPIAIVSEIPGTTRDLISVNLNIDGYQVELIDTAGIRETNDVVESIGVSRAKEIIKESDLILIVSTIENYSKFADLVEKFDDKKHILLINKVDYEDGGYIEINDKKYIGISIKNDKNLELLFQEIKLRISNLISNQSRVITTKRQRDILGKLYLDLISIIENFWNYSFLDILTEDIRNLSNYVSQLTGTIVNDKILDELFYNFCIGK